MHGGAELARCAKTIPCGSTATQSSAQAHGTIEQKISFLRDGADRRPIFLYAVIRSGAQPSSRLSTPAPRLRRQLQQAQYRSPIPLLKRARRARRSTRLAACAFVLRTARSGTPQVIASAGRACAPQACTPVRTCGCPEARVSKCSQTLIRSTSGSWSEL